MWKFRGKNRNQNLTRVLNLQNQVNINFKAVLIAMYRRPKSLVAHCAPLRAVKSLKGKSNASARWVRRQWNDPAVKQAKREGLRSRAAFKLRELNDRFQLLRQGNVVIDLGAAPGGWTQVAVEATAPKRCTTDDPPRVVAVDLKRFDPVEGAVIIVGDFRQSSVRKQLTETLRGRKADVVLSDMAPSFSGTFLTDSQHQLRLCHNALKIAELYLRPGGNFATKVLRCDGSEEFRAELKAVFDVVKAMKPQSSRPESTEMYFVAKGFKGITTLEN
ncbi:ribosomal rna large subunit methyltransferase j [Plasmopara halstedii]|uniref:rRNA methyltransferase 2, mitochondrial n=1 Tax=Plasmopara halstedii TaxID=4781 RepID=A0A0P1ALY3_PLAHL|nr:ribosomal rna large subunit methyltransferase j [Plasmopara halstedii]CEG42343.1 ribosomal rna large subunit methyltransferase j [Plasmopara halstedii]|eukprot:XP_024578712.1 ribosomal rna large subunit methyltransferase j [Plasmopara halstedii]